MNSYGCFGSTLHYTTPAHGGWDVICMRMLAPESYQFLICPFAYGRRGALGALKQELKDRISHYYIDQSDIINGYDNLILNTVEELLRVLKKRLRTMPVFVSYLNGLVGTDCDAAEAELELRHPDIRFRTAHMNSTTLDSNEPPPIGIQKRIYSLLPKQPERDGGVSSISSLVAVDPECKLHKMLAQEGISGLCYVSQYQDFDKWQRMTKGSTNLVLTLPRTKTTEEMEARCGIPYRFFPVGCDLDMVAERYRGVHEFLRPSTSAAYDLTTDRQTAEKAVEHTVKKLGKLSLILDSSVVVHPSSLAKAFSKYGFAVHRIFAQEVIPSDRKAFEWIAGHMPTVEILQPEHNDIVEFDRHSPDSLSIDVNTAYISSFKRVIGLSADEGLFGYYGIRGLMELMEGAAGTVIDLRVLIGDYGLVA